MKAKKLLVFLLALVIVLTLTVAACKPDVPTKTDAAVEVTSNKAPTIEVGEEYLLTYTSNDTVTVTASGGTYNQTTNRFSATTAGTYTLTVKASGENKNDVTVTVTITVTASAANKEALAAALASLTGLIENDYTTASWRNLTAAKEDAEEVKDAAGKTQAEVDAAKTALDDAVKGLAPLAITKAEVTLQAITYNSVVYSDDDYSNIAAIGEEITALNANAEVNLRSKYATEIAKIIDKLATRIRINIAELSNDAAMLVSALSDWNLHITATEDASVVVKIGLASDTENLTTLTAEEDGTYAISKDILNWDTEYVISVSASKEGKETVTLNRHVKFVRANYVANVSGASVENDVLKVTENYEWPYNEGKKIVPNGLQLIGDFSVTFDLKFTQGFGGAEVMALFLHREDGKADIFYQWIAIRHQDNKMELAYGGDKPTTDMPAGTVDINNTVRFRLTRTYSDGQSHIKGELIDIATGKVLHTQDNVEKQMGYSEIVSLGFQSEHVAWEVTNVTINMDAKARNVADLRTAIANFEALKSGNYTSATWTVAETAYNAAGDALKDKTLTQANIDGLTATLNNALENLQARSIEGLYELTKVTVEEEEVVTAIAYNEKNYTSAIYTNINEIAAEIEAISTELSYLDYTAKIEEALAKLESALAITLDTNLRENSLVEELIDNQITVNTTLNKEAISEGVTYEWTVNGEVVSDQTGATLTWKPAAFNTVYTISVVATYTTTNEDETTTSIESNTVEFVCSFVEVKAHIPAKYVQEQGATYVNNVFHIGGGAGWTPWEGRKLEFQELIFNGSFEYTIDFKVTGYSNPGVVTIHMMNADTLTPSGSRDNARVGYMALNTEHNKVEVNTGDRKTELGSAITDYIRTANSMVRLTLRAEKNEENKYRLTGILEVTLPNGTREVREYTDENLTGAMGGGMIVGINVESIAVDVTNVSYKLINQAGLLKGSVKSKLALHNAIAECEVIDTAKYVDATAFVKALNNAKVAYRNHLTDADYDTYATALIAAKSALVEKTVNVTVGGLDNGYTNFTNGDFEAVVSVEDGVSVTIEWSFDYLGDATNPILLNAVVDEPETQADEDEGDEPETPVAKHFAYTGAYIKLANGKYTGVTLKITVGDDVYTYTYQDFTVQDVVLKSNVDQVVIDDKTGKVTVTDGAGWPHKEQLVLDGVSAQQFEISFKITQTSEHGGDYRLACVNLFGEDCRLVLGYQRNGRGGRLHIGDDDMGEGTFVEIFKEGDNARTDDYNAIYSGTVTVHITCWVDSDSIAHVTWTIADAEGKVIYELNRTKDINHLDSRSTPRFTFENVNAELSDFEVNYTQFAWDIVKDAVEDVVED